MKLNIELFRFDKDSDYLPYYTKHFLHLKEQESIQDLLNTINEDQAFEFEKGEFIVCINSFYTYTSTLVKELVQKLGKDLKIEPESIRRVANDLICNEDDFIQKSDLLKPFMDKDDTKTYESYKLYYYASNTLNYEKNYIGDANLLLAYDLIQKNEENESSILKTLLEKNKGAKLHTSLENRVFNLDSKIEKKIKSIQNSLGLIKESEKQDFKSKISKNIKFTNTNTDKIKYDFKDFNLAYYDKKCVETISLVSKLKVNNINFKTSTLDLALDTFHCNEDLTYKIAADIMLDAFDNNADFLLVDSIKLFDLFDSNRKIFEKLSGRDITLPIIHSSELSKLAMGMHNEVQNTLKLHQVNPEII